MQPLLDGYLSGKFSFEQMYDLYNRIGTEGFKLEYYRPLFELAKANQDQVKLHGGFIPTTYAS